MERARELAHGLLICPGRATITGMLIAAGRQFVDCSAAYRLFSRERINADKFSKVASACCLEQIPPEHMLVAHMDDTIMRKTGKKIPGTSWRRDPTGPPFRPNFVWAQRAIQLTLSLPSLDNSGASKAIPVSFVSAPSVKKPSSKASAEELAAFKLQQKKQNLSRQGLEALSSLRIQLDEQGATGRELFISVDGSYTNSTVIKGLPERITLIGRIRKDACFNYLPEETKTKGRNKVYGIQAPTPEEIRQSDTLKWEQISAFAAGKNHDFKVKVVRGLKWRKAGKDKLIQLMVIAPLAYKNKKGGKILYRQPAYLICTDNNLDPQKMLQAYLSRWEIEVNFRDQKTTIGCGDAQVRNVQSTTAVPQFVVAMHAFLQLANHLVMKNGQQMNLPVAKWQKEEFKIRQSADDLLNTFKAQLYCRGLHKSFSDFTHNQQELKKGKKLQENLINTMFYQRN